MPRSTRTAKSGPQRSPVDLAKRSFAIVRLSDVAPKRVEWLWPERVAIGKLTLLAGDPGLGKSLVTLDIAARVSVDKAWPDGRHNEPGGVVLLSAEDDIADTIVPRLLSAGADLSRIVALQSASWEDEKSGRRVERAVTLEDLPAIEQAIKQVSNCRLLVIDPVSAYVGRADSHNNAEIRGLLSPLCELAAAHKVAILAATHLNKSSGSSAIYRLTGSLAFPAAARAAWIVAKDLEDDTGSRRLVIPAKNNLGPDKDGLAYRITASPLADHPGVEWESDPIRVSADEALEPVKERKPQKLELAMDWLHHELADGPVQSEILDERARGQPFGQRTLDTARSQMGIRSFKVGGRWFQSLPEPAASA